MSPEGRRRVEFTFNTRPDILAGRLIGVRIRLGNQLAEIVGTEWYPAEENTKGTYRKVYESEPGTLVATGYRNSVLPLVAAKGGACVLIREIEVRNQEGKLETVKGPGRVGEKLGLKKGDARNLSMEDPHDLIFSLVEINR